MKKHILVFFVFIFFINNISNADGDNPRKECQLFIDAFKNVDKNVIAQLIHYPLQFNYPIMPIKNKTEMIQRFDEVFDEEIINKIKKSSLETDWSEEAWRGITLDGDVWIDYDGKLKKMNYTTTVQAAMRERFLQKDRDRLYSPLRDYNILIGVYLSETYKIRLDYVKDNIPRLVLWKKDQSQSEEPEVIIENGIEEIQGSIGETYYIFTDKENYYFIYVGNRWWLDDFSFEIKKRQNSSLAGMAMWEIMDFFDIGISETMSEKHIELFYETE
jgi:hypothetical protein